MMKLGPCDKKISNTLNLIKKNEMAIPKRKKTNFETRHYSKFVLYVVILFG